MSEEERRPDLCVAIDWATRWLYLAIHEDKNAESATHFFAHVLANTPFVVHTLLTDTGKEFTDRFCTTGDRQPTGRHLFDQLCANQRIEYRLIQPRHPPTNGIVERLNGRIAEILGAERLSPPLICKRRSQATFGRTITEFPNALGTT